MLTFLEYKRIFAIAFMMGIISIISYVFWQEEYRFYVVKPPGESLPEIGSLIIDSNFQPANGKPAFIHFFQNDCKLSRINIEHIEIFTKQFQEDFDFYIAVNGKMQSKSLREKYNLPNFIRIIENVDIDTFQKFGINSTPQAVILDPDNTLYFRGNYNDNNGLCGPLNIKGSAPAIALASKSRNRPSPLFPPHQVNGWGCQL